MRPVKSKIQIILLLGSLSLIWGSSFILIKRGLDAFSPWQAGALRIVLAGVVFLPVFIARLGSVKPKVIGTITIFALCEIGFPPFLYALAQTRIDSSVAGILNSLVPVFTLVIGVLFFQQNLKGKQLTGVLLGLMGAAVLVFSRGSSAGIVFSPVSDHLFGLLVVAATLMYAFGGNILKNHLQGVPGAVISSVAFVIMSVPAMMILITSDFFQKAWGTARVQRSFTAIAILSLVGSALAIYLFSLLVQKSDALKASFVTYLIPVVALMWGVMDGEQVNYRHIIGMVLIIGSVFLIHKRRKIGEMSVSAGENRQYPRSDTDGPPGA